MVKRSYHFWYKSLKTENKVKTGEFFAIIKWKQIILSFFAAMFDSSRHIWKIRTFKSQSQE
jgi:hypothetical protein